MYSHMQREWVITKKDTSSASIPVFAVSSTENRKWKEQEKHRVLWGGTHHSSGVMSYDGGAGHRSHMVIGVFHRCYNP